MTQRFCKFVLKAAGWTIVGEKVKEKNCVILEAPHTSIWDFLIGYMYYRAVGGHLTVMIKKEAFIFPFSFIIRAMGGFPIDRKHPQATVTHIIHEMESGRKKPFHLVICPEGTRKAVHKWKTGYHTIAAQAGIPVYLSFVDWGHKRVGIHCRFEPLSGNAREDTDRIQHIYESLNLIAKYPEDYVTR